ncbi:polyisoprenoid-binding protein [bacterium]|nr:MAG: polyisoprenoid-binding protein [bacterium]
MTTQATTQQDVTWKIDGAHSSADFAVRHMMISKVKGTFRVSSGTITTQAGSVIPVAIDATIDAASVNTRETDRDNHLRSGDFLDVEHFPTLTFRATRITGKGQSDFIMAGELTIHGVTKPVELEAEFEGQGKDPWGNERVAYSAHTKINRKDFGMEFNQVLETGGVLVGEQVEISLAVEALR